MVIEFPELDPGDTGRLFRRQTGAHEIFRSHLEMEAELLLHFRIECARTRDPGAERPDAGA
jgi:hypothetical protein